MGSISENSAVLRSLSGGAREEWASLQTESDDRLRQEGIFSLARRQENSGNLEAAGQLYTDLLAQEIDPALRERAQRSLDAVLGRGEVGARAEFLMRRFSQEAADPVTLASMGLAGAAFRVTRFAVLSRLSLSSTTGFLTRGLGARALAGLAGFAVEAPVFTLSGRLGAEAFGRNQDWSPRALGRDLASSFLVLGGLKLAGWGSAAVYRRWGSTSGSIGARFAQNLFQQGGTLGGIFLGHGLEQWVGLRPHSDRETTLIDSLAMLLQFHVAGRLTQSAFGGGLRAWEQGIDRQTELLGRFSPRGWGSRNGVFPPVPAFASSLAPLSNMAMMTASSEGLLPTEGMVESTGLQSDTFPRAEPPLEYPPEIETLLRRVQARMRSPNYLSADRARLRELRPDDEDIDRIWFFQLEQMLALAPQIQVKVHDVNFLLEPAETETIVTDRQFLDRALGRLRSRGREGSLARRVVELRIPRRLFDGKNQLLESSLSTLGVFSEAQKRLGDRVVFFENTRTEMLMRIPSLSLYEKLLQTAFGRRAVQFHYVDGEIPRDDVMALRAQRVVPVGIFRQATFWRDIGVSILPFAFTVHDAVFHGVEDARALEGRATLAGKLYRWLQARRPGDADAELKMSSLSDGEIWMAGFTESRFLHDILNLFSEEITGLDRVEALTERNDRLLEMRAIYMEILPHLPENSEAASAWRTWEAARQSAYDQVERESEALQAAISARYAMSFSPVPKEPVALTYPADIEATLREIETRLSSLDYFGADREELLASRPSLEGLDRLLLFQGSDYASRIPAAEHDQVDAEVFTTLRGDKGKYGDPVLLQRAFARLGERGEPGSQARRVLRISIPADYLQVAALGPKEAGPWGPLSVITPMQDMEEVLGNRISFRDESKGMIRFYYPSFSLSEALIQSAFGREAGALLAVAGVLTRDQAARVRSLRLTPVGFGRGLLYLGDVDSEVHPFSFTAHDQYFHGPRDASQDSRYHELAAGWFYPRVRQYLPEHSLRERILHELADVLLPPGSRWNPRLLRRFMISPLREPGTTLESPTTSAAELAEARSAMAEGLRRLAIAEYRHHPILAGREKFMIAELRPLLGLGSRPAASSDRSLRIP